MSYEIVRTIRVKEDGVFLCSAANNVYPRDWQEWKCKSLSKMLMEQGRRAVDVEILKEYESGNLQGGKNKYTRALEVLKHFPEYGDFDWRGEPYDLVCERRKSPAFIALLEKALRTSLPRDKFIVFKIYGSDTVYLRWAKRTARWTYEKTKAKVFRYKGDAEAVKKCFYNSGNWEVEQINR